MKIKNSASVSPGDCVFCKIIAGKLASAMIYEDATYFAFLDNAPLGTGHTLVCPKAHGETLWDMNESAIGGLFALAARLSKAVVKATETDGFRIGQNNGEAANQVVAHVHVHIIPVKLSDKGQWLTRKTPGLEELNKIAKKIKSAIDDIGS